MFEKIIEHMENNDYVTIINDDKKQYPIFYLLNKDVIIRIKIYYEYPNGYKVNGLFQFIYDAIDDNFFRKNIQDSYLHYYGNKFSSKIPLLEESDILNYLSKEFLEELKLIDSASGLKKYIIENSVYDNYIDTFKEKSIEEARCANPLMIAINFKLKKYDLVKKGYETLVNCNLIAIEKLKKGYIAKRFSVLKNIKIKRKNYNEFISYISGEYDNLKITNDLEVVKILEAENTVYQEYIEIINNNKYELLNERLNEIKEKNIKEYTAFIKNN